MSRRLRYRLMPVGAIVVCGLFAATALAASGGGRTRFAGQTAQGYPVRITADRHHVNLVRVKVKLRCRNGGLLYDDLSDFQPAALRSDGRFNDLQLGPTDEVHWRGRLNGAKVRGSIRVKDKLKNGVRCDSGNVGFAGDQLGK